MIAVGAGASGCLNMWWDADIDALMTRTAQAADPGRAHPAGGGAVLRPDACRRLGAGARACRQLARRRLPRLHDLLLRRRLLDGAEALDGAEHRHRRRGRRLPADDRRGGGLGHGVARDLHPLRHHLPVDAAALLGARAREVRRTTRAPASRCCRTSPARPRRGGRSCSTRWCSRRSGCVPVAAGLRRLAYAVVSVARRARHAGAAPCRCSGAARASRRCGRRSSCSASRSCTCSCCSPLSSPSMGSAPAPARIAGVSADERRPRPLTPGGGETPPLALDRDRAGARRPGRPLLRRDDRQDRARRS